MGVLTGGLLAAPLAAEAQSSAKIPKIGILPVGTSASGGHLAAAFKQEMRKTKGSRPPLHHLPRRGCVWH